MHPTTRPGALQDTSVHADVQARARLLIVDEEPLNAAALEDFLRMSGYEQVQVLSGEEASVARLREEQADVLLLDLSLARPPALELLAQVRADRALRHLPVLGLADAPERTLRLKALQAGANDALVKPLDPDELLARLRNTLAAKARADRLALTDPLTGLPNRDSAAQRLDWALRHARRYDVVGAVLKVGLDRIRQVTEALGPTVGGELLRSVAQRLLSSLRDTDMVARGELDDEASAVLARGEGDEFTVLLPVVAQPDHAALVAQRLIDLMAQPFNIAGYEVVVSCRVGISVFPTDSTDRDTLLRQAAVAMRHGTQGKGGNSAVQFYSKDLNQRSVQRLGLERELRAALEQGQFVLHYQPKVQVATGRINGAEALVRWQHPRRGLVGPDEFIGMAEECGLIAQLGDWVLHQALWQMAQWRQEGIHLPHVAVNVSSLQFHRRELADDVYKALLANGLQGSSLCLELTESAILDSGEHVMDTLHAFKKLGVRLALDDFGTGYSSLSYLHRFPLDELKIDRSFLAECGQGGTAATITAAIIAMGHRLGLRVVAEGVEREDQLAFIRKEGCDSFQGYLFARPVPADEFALMLQATQEDDGFALPTRLDESIA